MNRFPRALSIVCFVFAASCGGDDEGGGSTVESGLPPSEKLSNLDQGDARTLCMSLADSFNNVLSNDELERISCTVLALPLSLTASSDGKLKGDVAKCKMLVNDCLDGETISTEEPAFEVEGNFIDEATCEDAQSSANFDSCEASVGEFERCASAQLRALSSRFDAINCDSLSDPEKLMQMNSSDLEDQPACTAFYEKCPNVSFGDDSEDIDFEEP